MRIYIEKNAQDLGAIAGDAAAQHIREAIAGQGTANIILATGTSQFETLKRLIKAPGIAWDKVVMFHLDEYINIPISHKASFRKYLTELFLDKLPPLKAAHLINGEADPTAECERLNKLIDKHPIDVALIGIGENCHLAFNDPPADFDTTAPYIIIDKLDEDCKQQQMNEGWFASLDEVPARAISMSVQQIMKSKHIICSVPDLRKAKAVKNCLEQPISNLYPASILSSHQSCDLFLETLSASLLSNDASHYKMTANYEG
ncbi:glucosamine-6-phosphate deaminase [Mucilaginibacter ginsenosidivorax]|uniref:Glucosamine-6-phosphate deaminase n=1 Tax=Mucilaginibacter ginsenosidivorax TaxID=862126 RepID=A0A5B8VX44_9SPHI|nr:glucosamine-6-phosphate deaminase [Mucilaginibacter ginsenosidivorax]QEC75205.1 glucosamine-6-phosphate deaminase [Mucilaginibacter ginsenosidivorax]